MDNTLTAPGTRLKAEKLAARAELKRRFSNTDLLTALIQKAVREAILEHKQAANPIAALVDGKVVIIQPEDIVVPDEPVFLEEWGEDLTLKKEKPSDPYYLDDSAGLSS